MVAPRFKYHTDSILGERCGRETAFNKALARRSCEDRKTVADYNGHIRLLREDRSRLDTFVRIHGESFSMLAHAHDCMCLLQIINKKDKKYLLERLSSEGRSMSGRRLQHFPRRFISERCIAIALNEITLFAVSGRCVAVVNV